MSQIFRRGSPVKLNKDQNEVNFSLAVMVEGNTERAFKADLISLTLCVRMIDAPFKKHSNSKTTDGIILSSSLYARHDL